MTIDTEKDIGQFKNRLKDLADKSYKQNIFTFTSFLGLPEQDIFWQIEREIKHVGFTLSLGDRKIIRFGNPEELGYEEAFPIVCVHITPLLAKFADTLSHRDFLGALMNLGIDRSTLGDIVVGEKEGYLYCIDSIAGFICENLTKVRHTNVRCQVVEDAAKILQEEPVEQKVQVSSERLDGVIAKVYQMSRGDVLEYFRAKRVFVNGRLCENNSKALKPRDVINVRGHGKFSYEGVSYETKKGKLNISVKVYK